MATSTIFDVIVRHVAAAAPHEEKETENDTKAEDGGGDDAEEGDGAEGDGHVGQTAAVVVAVAATTFTTRADGRREERW